MATCFQVSWDHVCNSVKQAVSWGLSHRDLDEIESIGVDEVQWKRGHKYQTLVYQIDCRVASVCCGSARIERRRRYFAFFVSWASSGARTLQFVCSDMWQAYLKVIAKKVPHALHVLDRFHVMQKMSKAIDQVRAEETRQMKEDGYEPLLVGSRWLLLKRPENLSAETSGQVKPTAAVQLEERAESSPERGLPDLFWGVHLCGLGWQVS